MAKRKPKPKPVHRTIDGEDYIGPYRLNEAGYPLARFDLYDKLTPEMREHWRKYPGKWYSFFADSKSKISV